MYPTNRQIEDLHRKYAPNHHAFNIIYSHCRIVWQICDQILSSQNIKINTDLVKSGALLHDIGAYKLISREGVFDETNYIKHGIIGYEILQSEGLSEPLCRIAKCHTGLGLTKQYVLSNNLPLPADDYTAESLEEKLVMYADKFHSKNPKFNTFDDYCKTAAKFGPDNVQKFRELAKLFGVPDINKVSK